MFWNCSVLFWRIYSRGIAKNLGVECGPENGGVNTPNLIIPISFNREDHDRQLDGMGLGSSEVQLYVGSFWQGILAIGTYLP